MRDFFKLGFIGLCMVFAMSIPAHGEFMYFMENPLVGEPAPNAVLETNRGNRIDLAEFRKDKNAIIYFWATWCPHCHLELKELNKHQEEFTKKDIVVIPINVEDTKKAVEKYLKRNKIDMEIFLDPDYSFAESYALIGVPTFFFVNKDGIITAVEHSIVENLTEIFAED